MPTKEHLRLFRSLLDTGANVFRNLADIRLLNKDSISFMEFLEKEKHFFYHHNDKIRCCECSKNGLSVNYKDEIEWQIFKKVYGFDTRRYVKSHLVKKGGKITQKCIHGVYPRKVTLDELDLCDLNFFLLNKGRLSSQETSAIKVVMQTRSRIVHPPSSSSLELSELNIMWGKMENALLELSQPKRYKDIVKMHFDQLRERKDNVKLMTEIKDKQTETAKEMKKMKEEILGSIQNITVIVKAFKTSAEESQASGGDGQIKMTTTLKLPSTSLEEEMEIVKNLPSELNVHVVDSDNGKIKIDGKKVNSIVLDLRVSSNIFTNTQTLRSALLALIQEVLKNGNIDTNDQDTIYVTLACNSSLTIQETDVLEGLFTQQKSKLPHDVGSEGRMDTEETDERTTQTNLLIESVQDGAHSSKGKKGTLDDSSGNKTSSYSMDENKGKSIDELPGAKYSCYSCQQKDNQITKLETNFSKLKECVWTLNRLVYETDLDTLEVKSDKDSGSVSKQLSEEVLEEKLAKSSESVMLQSSASTTITSTNPEKMEYYTRYAYVIITVAGDIFRDIMRSAISVEQLYGLCIKVLHTFTCHHQSNLKEMRLSNSYAALDLCLLYKVFKQFSLIPRPTKGWGMVPDKEDIGIGDDVERLRLFRSQFLHRSKSLIRRLEFNENFSQLLAIGRRVDMYFEQKTSYEQRIIKSMKDDMDFGNHSGVEHALKELKIQKERLESEPITFFWGDSFELSLRSLKQMLKEHTIEGKKKHPVQIVLNSQQEVEQCISILHSLKEEMSEVVTGIEFILYS